MTDRNSELAYKDAIYFSTHKFIGGPQTPVKLNGKSFLFSFNENKILFSKGILVAKKNLFKNPVPNGCGGGTVFFVGKIFVLIDWESKISLTFFQVTKKDHRYLKDGEMREEGGTPAIIEGIRAGLVFQFKQAIGIENIIKQEKHITAWALI